MRTALFCQQLWLLDNLWDASSLLPIRRAAWVRLRLPSTSPRPSRRAEVNTLLIDCDPQSNATSGLGLVKDPERISTYHLLLGAAAGDEALATTELEQLWLIPSHKNLIGANIELVEADRREYRLREAIAPLRDRFQYIVLDCPPALDLLTLNALVAADSVLIPMQAEYFALEGISELMDTVERIRVELNPGLEIEGVVLTMLDERTNLAQQVTAELRKFFGEKVCCGNHTAEHTAGGGAQPWQSGAGVRSAIEGGGELHTAGEGDHRAASGGGWGWSCGDQRLIYILMGHRYIRLMIVDIYAGFVRTHPGGGCVTAIGILRLRLE